MARPVDERIVRLSMDNNDFRSKATASTSILQKLSQMFGKTKNLNLDKSVKALDDVDKKSKAISMDKLANAATTVASKFSALGVMATTALVNIANRAVDAGIQLAKSFSFDLVKDGFSEYELKMKSIQTIMSNTQGASSLEQVTAALDDLNLYADKTIYNFAEMTSNIGTFTAAGVGLEQSATAIKGIANLAAASGSNSQQASTAMYQLSQALAAGSVKLQDWNSVVNAGMGGKLFQNALLETAANMGIANSGAENFRESLQEGWITTDVLINTLERFSNDESMLEAATKVRTFTQLVDTAKEAVGSGWAQTWEIIFGNFQEAGDIWTAANDAISVGIEASAQQRNQLLGDFVKMGGRAKLIEAVSNAFRGLSQWVNIVKGAFAEVFPPMTAEKLMKIATSIADMTAKMKLNDETANKVKTVFKGLFSILDIGLTVVKTVGRAIGAMIPEGAGGNILNLMVKIAEMIMKFNETIKSSEKVNQAIEKIRETTNKVASSLGEFGSKLASVFGDLGGALSAAWNFIKPIFSAIGNAIKDFMGQFTAQDVATGGILAVIFMIARQLKSLTGSFGDIVDKIKDAVTNIGDSFSIFDDLGESLSALTGAVKAGTLVAIAAAVMMLAGSMMMISSLDTEDIAKGLATIAAMMKMLQMSLAQLALSGGGIKNAIYATTVLPALATSILILSAALKIIESVDPDALGRSIVALAAMIGELVGAIVLMNKFGGKIGTSAVSLIALSTSIVILAGALKILETIETGDLVKGVVAIGAILLELAVFLKIVNGAKFNMGTALSMVILTGAIMLMVVAIKQIADIPVNTIQKGLVTIGVLLLELGAFTKLVNGAKVMSTSVGMVLLATAIRMLVGPIEELGSMSYETLAKGLGTMAIALAEVVLAMRLAQGGMSGAAGILIAAAAINALVPALQALGSMSWESIGKGLLAFGAALGIVALASKLIGITGAVALLGFAAAVTAVGVAVVLVAAGFAVFVAALSAAAALTVPAVENIVKAFDALLDGLVVLTPKAVALVMTFLVSVASALAQGAPQLAASGLELIAGLLSAFAEGIGPVTDSAVDLLVAFADAFGDNIDRVVNAAVDMVLALINGVANAIRDNSEDIVGAVMNLIESILEIMIDALAAIVTTIFGWIPGVGEATKGLADKAKGVLRDNFGVEETSKIGKDGAKGFTDGVDSAKGDATKAGAALGKSAADGAKETKFDPIGELAGQDFISGVASKNGDSEEAGADLANQTLEGLARPDLSALGKQKGEEFSGGIEETKPIAQTKGIEVAEAIKIGADSVDTSDAGKKVGADINLGIDSIMPDVQAKGTQATEAAKAGANATDSTDAGTKVGQDINLGIDSILPEIQTKGGQVAEAAKTGSKAVDATDAGTKVGQDFNLGIDSVLPEAQTKGQALADNAKAGSVLPDLSPEGVMAGNAFSSGIESTKGSSNTAGNSIATGAKTSAGGVTLTPEGSKAGNAFASGINSTKGSVSSSGRSMADSGKNGAGGVNYNPTGTSAGRNFATGLGAMTGAARGSGVALGTAGNNGAASVDASGSGSNFGQGFANGISGKAGVVQSAAAGLAGLAKGALEGLLAIFSPSRVMIKDGGYFGEGFAIGITRSGGIVEEASEGIAIKAKDAVVTAAATFEKVLNDNLNLEPTITPVLDMSNLTKPSAALSADVALSGNFSEFVMANGVTRSALTSKTSSSVETNNQTTFITKLDAMLSKMDSILSKMDSMGNNPIIMNEKVVGQQVAQPVNNALKERNSLINRINGVK